ncbi:hypothetical protein BGX29_005588 [Mortierella sp. GBA35]|nr:hypothetical protein BGX29_005588 [Mortierella sp. GBA35]
MQDKDVAAFFTLNEPGHWRCLLRWAKFLRRNFKTRHRCPTPELAAHRYIFNLRVIWKLTPPDVAGEQQAEAARLLQSCRHEELLERLKAIWEDELPPQKKILSSSAAREPAPPFTDTAAEAEAEAAIEAKTATGTKGATGAGAEAVKEVGAETAMDAGPKM